MAQDLDGIVSNYKDRQQSLARPHAGMREFNAYINDEQPVPLAEMDRHEQSAIANLAAQGLTQLAERAASVLPDEFWPSVEPGDHDADKRAQTRRRASLGWSEANAMAEVYALRAEYLLAHAMSPVSVMPAPKTGVPTWMALDPLTVFPAPVSNPLDITPSDCIIAKGVSWRWVEKTYGNLVRDLKRPAECKADTQFVFLDYIDDEQIAHVLLSEQAGYGTVGNTKAVLLDTNENKADRPLVFIPTLHGAAGRRGQFAGTMGIHQMRAKLAALAYITASKGASPDTWLEPFDGQGDIPEIVSTPDPRTGTPGVIAGGKLRTIDMNPGFVSMQMLSTLERELRNQGGIPAALTGEAPTTVQTGRLSAGLLANAIDFTVQKVQRKFERSGQAEKKAAVAIVKTLTPGRRSFYVGWDKAKGQVDYDPAVDFETDDVLVRYPLAGSDMNNLILRNQSKTAIGTISKQTSREQDPEIDDPEQEHDRIISEQLEAILMNDVSMKSQDPASGWNSVRIAQLRKIVRTDKMELDEAILKINDEIKQEAAAAAQSPVDPLSPEGQQGVEPEPAIPEGPPSLQNLSSVLSQLRPRQAA